MSPFKPAPGASPRVFQPAALLVEQAAALVHQQGPPHEAEALLHSALERCATSDTQLAMHIVDLLLELERGWQRTSASSGTGRQTDGPSTASSAAALMRQGVEALEAGQERAAVRALKRALSACPTDQVELRRRIALFLELVLCKSAT
jgi:hypothetical protein